MTEQFTSRRTVLAAAGTVPLATTLAACGDSEDSGGTGDTGADGGEKSPGAGESKGKELGSASEIPEGGGKIFKSEKVVVTQPSAGEYKAFSAVCTHKGCVVSSVSDGSIGCACHGSKFDAKDGAVTQGPATKALPEVNVTVEGDSIKLA
ncbi:Rieske (2Fe-2S) protein [Streptomyces armeniacus]|uniref:Cytochrome bc1 complex Rieske iron-sulfur subunit n=1 Tax=Streptomyces armeniacus TaxID=83291 RepID=A0A345XS33_9ACTN|nr:Rieske (2Fe-2S) protein [Streptomyces armeniacus]AXK34449.1 Rieske (2Fe-2S) protein [Streptomyces armeniacus]